MDISNLNNALREIDIDWDDNMAIPVANAENKYLEDAISQMTAEKNNYQNELTEHRAKVNALRNHIINVKEEFKSTQNLFNARKNELQTEDHLRSIAERENGRLMQENQRLLKELAKLEEKRNANEVT
jgi:coiled-coil domain-containing protein 39